MVRPPAAAWDKKTKYASIGRARGADYDDVFVISALFHHISVVRVRVPDRLLAVLDGDKDDGDKSWVALEVRRSKWFDFFKVEDRLAAMQLLWSMMNYLMRADTGGVEVKAAAEQEVKKEQQVESREGGENEIKEKQIVAPSEAKSDIAAEVVTPVTVPAAVPAAPPTVDVPVAVSAAPAPLAPVDVALPPVTAEETALVQEEEEEEETKKDGQGDVEMANS